MSPKVTVGAASPALTSSPAPAFTTASGASDRPSARPVAFPKPVPAEASHSMKQFAPSPFRNSPVEPPKYESAKSHTSLSSASSATPCSAPQRPPHDADFSAPVSRALASVPVASGISGAFSSGGAFKPTLKSDSARPNSVPAYLYSSSPFLPSPSGVSPPTFPSHNNGPTSSQSAVNKGQELEPGTPPVYVFPDGTEAAYLTENALNHHFENSGTQAETRRDCSVVSGAKTLPPANTSLVPDTSAALDLRGSYTEVSRRAEDTFLTTCSDNLSTCLSDSTDTISCHHESNTCNSDSISKMTGILTSTRPARPTSLPLISLSSLINNISFAPPASFPCNPASSPSVSAACPTARSFSDIALPQNPVSGDVSLPCVVAADPCVGPQVGGVSALTAASPPSRALPAPSSTPPSHTAAMPDPTFVVPEGTVACSQHTGPLSLLEHECKTQPPMMKSIEAEELDFIVGFRNEFSHVFESKEVKLSMADVHRKEFDSYEKEDNIANVSNRPLPQAHDSLSARDEHQEGEGIASNFSQGIPLIEVSDEPRKSSLDEEQLRKFMEEIKLSFQNAPSAIDSIEIDDLKPPEFYRSVSRNSMDQELEDLEVAASTSGWLADTCGRNLGRDSLAVSHAEDDGDKKAPVESPHCEERYRSQKQDNEENEEVESVVSQTEAVAEDSCGDADDEHPDEEEEDDEGEGSDYGRDMRPRLSLQNRMVFTRRCSYPTNESPSPPLSSPATSTNPPTPSAGPAAIYTAEVKVVQRSLPPTPAPDGESPCHLTLSAAQIHRVACPLFLQVGRIPCARIHATLGPLMKYNPRVITMH